MEKKQSNSHFNQNAKIEIVDGILWIFFKRNILFWDGGSFRPDPIDVLEDNKKYKVSIVEGFENLFGDNIVYFPKKIMLESNPKIKFINIR